MLSRATLQRLGLATWVRGGCHGCGFQVQQLSGAALLGAHDSAAALAVDTANHTIAATEPGPGSTLCHAHVPPYWRNLAGGRSSDADRRRDTAGLARWHNDRLGALPRLRSLRRSLDISR